ncbi:hypothetical protein NDU88_000712 [Pleurodeles waltl]|uniref:Uncharacterized protein n=1 Tax=Pleurodeles waltl TaxID=8319 RepID=A0AAV7TGI2_PLEWA|nr:hypothetical protein NDU88_000712 [Pleurodeles waltl]
MGRRNEREEEEEAIEKDGEENEEGETSGVVHEEDDLPARESDVKGMWPVVRHRVEKSDEEGVRCVILLLFLTCHR